MMNILMVKHCKQFHIYLQMVNIEMLLLIAAEVSSGDDEIDENNHSYLNNVKNFATKKAAESGFEISAEIRASIFTLGFGFYKHGFNKFNNFVQDDEDSDDESELSDGDIGETTLEVYLTPIDDEEAENPIDEYIEFYQVMTRMTSHILSFISFFFLYVLGHVYCRFSFFRSSSSGSGLFYFVNK